MAAGLPTKVSEPPDTLATVRVKYQLQGIRFPADTKDDNVGDLNGSNVIKTKM